MSYNEPPYRGLVDNGAAGLVLLDPLGLVKFANPWAHRFLGENLIGSEFASRFIETSRENCAGFVTGLVEALTARWVGGTYEDLTVFALLLVILMVRPTGLLGERTERII